MPEKLLSHAKNYAEEHGFGTVQEFIKEAVREKVFEEELTGNEVALVKRLLEATEKNNLYGTEEELFKKLKRK